MDRLLNSLELKLKISGLRGQFLQEQKQQANP